MEYKTVYGLVGQVDQELNILAANGWTVQSMCSPGLSMEMDESGTPYETPFMVYLLARTRTDASPASAPERRFIGRKTP